MDSITKVEKNSYKLIDLSLKIYSQTKALSELEKCGLTSSKTYKRRLEILGILIKKESSLLDYIMKVSENVYDVIRIIVENTYCYKNNEEYRLVAERLINKVQDIIVDSAFLAVNFYVYHDGGEDEEIVFDSLDSEDMCAVFSDVWFLRYLLKLQEDSEKYERIKGRLIAKKYKLAFTNKDLFDELASVSFNIQALMMLKENISIKDMQIDLDEEEDCSQEALFDIVNSIGVDIAGNDNQVNRKDMLDMFKFFIPSLDNFWLMALKETIKGNMEKEDFDKRRSNHILRIVLLELSKRGLLENNGEKNKECAPVKEDVMNNLFSLIRLDEKILDLYDSIMAGVNKDENLSKLETFLEFEDELISKVALNNGSLEVIVSFLDNDLDFIIDADTEYDLERKKFLIGERIFSSFRDLQEERNGQNISDLDFHILNQHILRSLCDFKELIDAVPLEDRGSFLRTYGEEFFSNKSLSSEFVLGQKSDVDIVLDDGLLATLTGTSDFEYGYEKDEILFEKCLLDIALVYNSSANSEDAATFLLYKLNEVNDIIQNISLEHLFYIRDHLESMSLEGEPNEFAVVLFDGVKRLCKSIN